MHLYFPLLSAVFSTMILGNPTAEAQLTSSSSFDNFISSFFPQDLPAPNLDQGTSADAALESQSSDGNTFQDFAVPDQQTRPNLVFDIALAPNSQWEKIDDETAHYRGFNCNGKYSVCCEGRDHSIDSHHLPCSESKQSPHPPPPSLSIPISDIVVLLLEIENHYAGYEEVSSLKDMRYGQYCYRPFYTAACGETLWGVLQVRYNISISLLSFSL